MTKAMQNLILSAIRKKLSDDSVEGIIKQFGMPYLYGKLAENVSRFSNSPGPMYSMKLYEEIINLCIIGIAECRQRIGDETTRERTDS